MPLTLFLRSIALGACLLLPLQPLCADEEAAPPSPPDKPEAVDRTEDVPLPARGAGHLGQRR